MKFTQKKPCNECPFRKNSINGWVGSATPEEFIDATLHDVLMPCHTTVDYESNWKYQIYSINSNVQHCVGSRFFFKNICKISKDEKFRNAMPKERSELIFSSPQEFIKHHNKFKK